MAFCVILSRKIHWSFYDLCLLRNCKHVNVNSLISKTTFIPDVFVSNSGQGQLNSRFYSMINVHEDSVHNQCKAPAWRSGLGRCRSQESARLQQAFFSTLDRVGASGCISREPSINIQVRCKHSKDRGGKGGKGKSIIQLSSEELNSVINEKQLLFELDAALEEFKVDLVKSVAIRTNVGSLEELPVELEGDTFPLNELAQIHRKSTHLVIIDCSAFPQATKTVCDAIKESGMNLNPQQEGTKIAVPLPKVTREHREGLASKAKVLCNRCKESLRQVHNTYVRKAKNKEGQVASDLLFKVTQKIKEMLDERTKAADALLAAKQAELLK